MKSPLEVYIAHESYTTVTREADPRDPWDADDIEEEHYFHSFSLSPDEIHNEAIQVSFLPDKDATYYLVVVRHSDGDSFHHETGKAVVIGLYDKLENAELAEKIIREDRDNYAKGDMRNTMSVLLPNSVGEMNYVVHTFEWCGFFNGLEDVEIHHLKGK